MVIEILELRDNFKLVHARWFKGGPELLSHCLAASSTFSQNVTKNQMQYGTFSVTDYSYLPFLKIFPLDGPLNNI